jgi:hypothetical protein
MRLLAQLLLNKEPKDGAEISQHNVLSGTSGTQDIENDM